MNYESMAYRSFKSRTVLVRGDRKVTTGIPVSNLEPLRGDREATDARVRLNSRDQMPLSMLGGLLHCTTVVGPKVITSQPHGSCEGGRSEERRVGKECRCRWWPECEETR